MGYSEKIYPLLPTWAQRTAVSAFGLYWHWLRFGPDTAEKYVRALQKHRVQERLGAGVEVIVETVQRIPRTSSGKFGTVISHVKDRGFSAGRGT